MPASLLIFGHGLTPVEKVEGVVVARDEFWRSPGALRFPEDPNARLEAFSRRDD